MTRIFLTGATGNAGRPVLAELLRRNFDVTALVRFGRTVPHCRNIVGDLCDITRIAGDVAAADGVIHLASPRSNERHAVVHQDIQGTGDLIDAWRKGNFVYASSQTVYGIPRESLTESSQHDAMCWYDLGKLCNEYQLWMAEPLGERRAAVSIRMALLFGNGPRRNDRQYLPGIYDECLRGTPFVFDSEQGMETYGSSFIGEEDFGRAIVDALGIGTAGPYNIASGFCTWKELIHAIDRCAGTRSRFVIRPGGHAERGEFRLPQSRSFLETTAFSRETGFSPRQTLEELIDRYAARERAA